MTKKEKKDKILTTAEMYKELDERDKIFINGYLTGKREERAKWERKPAQEGEVDSATKKIGEYIKQKGFNLSEISRKTGITYMSLYNSFLNEKREREQEVKKIENENAL